MKSFFHKVTLTVLKFGLKKIEDILSTILNPHL